MALPRSIELGKLVEWLSSEFLLSGTWVDFVRCIRHRPCIHEAVGMLPHPAAAYLQHLQAEGAPVTCSTPPWTQQQRDASIQRGPHPSTSAYLGFLEEDMADMIQKGYWVVLPYHLVKDLPNLRISPMGAVPQRDRRPRTIVDYSYSEVNQHTQRGAPPQAMQFGRALDRVLQVIVTADPTLGPVFLSKIDLSDGFYRVRLRDMDIPTLGVAFPTGPGEIPLVAFPLALPMGWTESPPYFCSVTESLVDLINSYAYTAWAPPPHPLEHTASTPSPVEQPLTVSAPPPTHTPVPRNHTTIELPCIPGTARRNKPLKYADVYVDDEILVAQGSAPDLNRFRRQALHINDRIFRPNDLHDNPTIRREPISMKKLAKGDACWSTRKLILGWLLDTIAGTIELPPHRKDRLLALLTSTLARKRVTTKDWHRLLGELRSMVLGIPGGRGLFSQLQVALRQQSNNRVRLHKEAKNQLNDFLHLATDLASRPTRIAEVVPSTPTHRGCCDAAKSGMGGVWFPSPTSKQQHPIVWRTPFPPAIQHQLVSDSNPQGTITNSDLELAGTIAHAAVLTSQHDVREQTIAIFSDNTPAVAWGCKASVTTQGPASYLLRTASLHQRQHRYLAQHFYIPGPANHLADIASRRFDLSDAQLLSHLNCISPHSQSWKLLPLPPDMHLRVITDLQRKHLAWPSLSSAPAPKIGFGPNTGSHTPNRSDWIRFSRPWKTRSPTSASSHTGSEMAAPVAVVAQFGLNAYVTKSWPSRRASPHWVDRTLASPLPVTWTQDSPPSTPPTATPTPLLTVSSLYQSKSSTGHSPSPMPAHKAKPPSPWPGSPSSSYYARANIARPTPTTR